jgi:hypothetical protein
MNTQNNIFIITSTINTPLGLISPPKRFQETIGTIQSIRKNFENSIIVMVDNSSNQLESQNYDILKSLVDFFVDVGQRKFCKFINDNGIKGAGECYMLLTAFNLLKKQNLNIDRIYKISGRYKLSDSFDSKQYENTYGKYCFKTRDVNHDGKTFLHTRMWSFCGSLLDECEKMVQNSYQEHVLKNITIEESIYNNIDLTKLVEYDMIHCEGYIAPWNKLITD